MPARRRVSIRQMELLVEFAEFNPDVALVRFPGGPQAVRVTREPLKHQTNGEEYWIEFKAKTKGKAADSRRNASATGGGPNKLVPLNELLREKRVLAILGPVAVEGLPGVHLPIDAYFADEIETPVDSGSVAPDPVSYDQYPIPVHQLPSLSPRLLILFL